VIRGLDKGKSGSETRNVKSREAIRYLEQRFLYPTPYLYGQRPEEVIQVENVPKGFLGIISCCKYFVQDLENTGCEFFLVTDDAELALIAKEHSINVLGSVDWSSKFK
jgi:hypothetical protein